MADEKTRGDSIRLYLTGAATHGGAQTDPDLSLGLHQSTTEVEQLSVSRASAISNITIDHVDGSNGLGDGTLTASGSDTLNWTPPGGSAGADVTILNGETKIIEGLNAPEKHVRVTRTSATALTGAETDTLTDVFNDVVGFDNVSSAEASAGDDEYRCACFENVSGSDVTNLKVWISEIGTEQNTDTTQLGASGSGTIETTGDFDDWPDSGWGAIDDSGGTLREVIYYSSRTSTVLTVPAAGRGRLGTTASAGASSDTIKSVPGIRIAKEAPSSQPSGSFTDKTVAGEDSDPLVSWQTPYNQNDAVDIGTLATTYIYGLWFHREIPASAVSEASVLNIVEWSFDAA